MISLMISLMIIFSTYALYEPTYGSYSAYSSSYSTPSYSSTYSAPKAAINDYGWKSYTRGGLGFTNFGGGTDGPTYQYERTFSYSACPLCKTYYAKESDFGTLDRRDLNYDPMRDYHRDPEQGENRNPDWD